jgi:hypothetical protein
MAGEDSDEDDLLGRCDSYDSEGGSQMLNDVWDADVDSDSVLGSNDLSPVLCPSCPMDSEHTKTITTTLASTGILTGVASHTATKNDEVSYAAEFPSIQYMKKWVRDASMDNPTMDVAPVQDEITRDTVVVELLEGALKPSTMVWNPQLHNVNRSLKKEFATIADVSCKFTLNKLQHAAFRKIGSALLAR